MKKGIDPKDSYVLTLEVGQYYNGYTNPETITDYEQKTVKSEWTIFIRTKNPSFRPFISQFISSVEFILPGRALPMNILAPERNDKVSSDSSANYQIMTKINRSNFKLDKDNKEILIDLIMWSNKKLESDKVPAKPFSFCFPLDFDNKEQC
jgi:hypothetical protein